MMIDRKAFFGSHDKANAQVLQRIAVRNSKAATRRQRNEARSKASSAVIPTSLSEESLHLSTD